jgi:hypothetical protein
VTALACTALGLIIAGCAALAIAARRRRPRIPGLPGDGKGCLSGDEARAFDGIISGWKHTANEERSTT